MASEKKKQNLTNLEEKVENINLSFEVDRQFLEKNNVSAIVRDSLHHLLNVQPVNPISFLADYFESACDKTGVLDNCLRLLSLTHYASRSFDMTMRDLYQMLGQVKVLQLGLSHCMRGLTGDVLMEFLTLVLKETTEAGGLILRKLACKSCEFIPFTVFRHTIILCLIFLEYMHIVHGLFEDLDFTHQGLADKSLCDDAIRQFSKAIRLSNKDANQPLDRLLDAGKLISIVTKIETSMNPSDREIMSEEDFSLQMAIVFISKL